MSGQQGSASSIIAHPCPDVPVVGRTSVVVSSPVEPRQVLYPAVLAVEGDRGVGEVAAGYDDRAGGGVSDGAGVPVLGVMCHESVT